MTTFAIFHRILKHDCDDARREAAQSLLANENQRTFIPFYIIIALFAIYQLNWLRKAGELKVCPTCIYEKIF